MGIPATCGAVSSSPFTVGFELISAVRYPVVNQTGNSTPTPRINVLK